MLSYAQFTRRDRFVLAAALSFGLADILVPDIFTHLFDGVDNPSSGLQGLFNSITIILSTPCMCPFPPPPINAPESFTLQSWLRALCPRYLITSSRTRPKMQSTMTMKSSRKWRSKDVQGRARRRSCRTRIHDALVVYHNRSRS